MFRNALNKLYSSQLTAHSSTLTAKELKLYYKVAHKRYQAYAFSSFHIFTHIYHIGHWQSIGGLVLKKILPLAVIIERT